MEKSFLRKINSKSFSTLLFPPLQFQSMLSSLPSEPLCPEVLLVGCPGIKEALKLSPSVVCGIPFPLWPLIGELLIDSTDVNGCGLGDGIKC